jgi:hypothetical protein
MNTAGSNIGLPIAHPAHRFPESRILGKKKTGPSPYTSHILHRAAHATPEGQRNSLPPTAGASSDAPDI